MYKSKKRFNKKRIKKSKKAKFRLYNNKFVTYI